MPSLPLLYLNGLELSFSFVDFFCWPNLQKCSTSALLNLRNSSYNSSNVLGHSLTRWLWSWAARNALITCVIACSSETSGTCALSRRNMRKKSDNVSLSYYWQEKKSSSILTFAWKPWKLTRNFSLSCAHDVIDLSGNLAYQLAIAFSSVMINDLVRVISSPPNEAIAAS
jgi:hypothetical protein